MKTRILLLFFFCLSMANMSAQSDSDTLNKVDASGNKHGYWKKYDGDTLRYEGRFDHGIPVGEFVYYYYNKTIKAKTTYTNKGVNASTVMYFPNGAKLSEGNFVSQKREGTWLNYDGYDHVIARVEYKQGLKHGKSITYYQEGGLLEVAEYENGQRHGNYVQYFPDSVLKIKGTYANGKRNGIFAFYHPNGLVYSSGLYKNDLREGDWMLNDEQGKPIVKESFKAGIVEKREVYQKEKDPEFLKEKDSELELKNRGKTSPDNGINDPRYDGY